MSNSDPLSLLVLYADAHTDDDDVGEGHDLASQELRKLKKYLDPLEREGWIRSWATSDFSYWGDLESAIEREIACARIALLLITTPDFVASSKVTSGQFSRLLARWAAGEVLLIPIFLRWVDGDGTFSFEDAQGRPRAVKLQEIAGAIGSPDSPVRPETRDQKYSELSGRLREAAGMVAQPPSLAMVYLFGMAVVSEIFALAAVRVEPKNPLVFAASCLPILFLAIAVGMHIRNSGVPDGWEWSEAQAPHGKGLRRLAAILGVQRKEFAWDLLFAYLVASWLIELVASYLGGADSDGPAIATLASVSAVATTASMALAVRWARSGAIAVQMVMLLMVVTKTPVDLLIFGEGRSWPEILGIYTPTLLIFTSLLLSVPLLILRFFPILPWGLPIAFGCQALLTGIRASGGPDGLFSPTFGRYMLISAAVTAIYSWFFRARLGRLNSPGLRSPDPYDPKSHRESMAARSSWRKGLER